MDDFMYMDYRYPSLILFVGIIALTIGSIYLVICAIANWKLFKKAGRKGWECIIPIYSYWVLVEIAGLQWWWFLLVLADSIVTTLDIDELSMIANLISLFASFNIYYNIAKKFGKSNGTSVCAGIFSFIFVFIFGFSKNEKYDSSIPVSANGIFGTPDSNTGNNNNNYQNNSNDKSTEVVDTDITIKNNNTVKNEASNDKVVVQEHSYCGNCGTKLDKDVKFCPNCGKENI